MNTVASDSLRWAGECYVYNDFLPAALAFAHRALAAADSLARAFALTFLLTFLEARLPFRLTRPALPVTPTLARTDILLLPRRVPTEVKMSLSSASRVTIRSLMATARRRSWSDRFAGDFDVMRKPIARNPGGGQAHACPITSQ